MKVATERLELGCQENCVCVVDLFRCIAASSESSSGGTMSLDNLIQLGAAHTPPSL
jgi:hypothetical protein